MRKINVILYFFTSILLLMIACDNKQDKVTRKTEIAPKVASNKTDDSVMLIEKFVDSINIGKKGANKIELSHYRQNEGDSVIIKFYSRSGDIWIAKDAYRLAKDPIADIDVQITDMSGDKLNDITYVSGIGARGANEIRTLFVYDNTNDRLVMMKNSENYPNMQYNKELKCIDAFLVYGGSSTAFLRIQKDSLFEFASVELFDGLTVTTYDKNGKPKILRHDTTVKTEYIRYKNFDPLIEDKVQ